MMGFSRYFLATALSVSLASPSTVYGAQDPLKAQQMEYAKAQFGEGEALLAQGDFRGAVQKYETAYQYAPELHVLNYNIGVASLELKDCAKAKTSFQRFLDLVADHPMRGDAQKQLMEIESSGCASVPPVAPGVEPTPIVDDAPKLEARPAAGEVAPLDGDPTGGDVPPAGETPTDGKYQYNKQMKVGIALIAVGGVSLASSLVTAILTRSAASKLAAFGGEQSATGFTSHSYADDQVFKLDRRRKRLGPATVVLLGVGAAAGIIGLAVYFAGLKKCKAGDTGGATARRGKLRLTGAAPAVFSGGAGVGASFAFAGPTRGISTGSSGCK